METRLEALLAGPTGEHGYAVMAIVGRSADPTGTPGAAARAVAAGAAIVEVAPSPDIVMRVRELLPETPIAVTTHQVPDVRAVAGAGADLLIGPPAVAAAVAATGMVYAGPDPDAATMPAGRFLLDGGTVLDGGTINAGGTVSVVGGIERAVGTGFPVLVTPAGNAMAPAAVAPGPHPESVAITAVCAWLGVRVFRTADVAATRQVLDMVASLQGHRPPAVSRRGLA